MCCHSPQYDCHPDLFLLEELAIGSIPGNCHGSKHHFNTIYHPIPNRDSLLLKCWFSEGCKGKCRPPYIFTIISINSIATISCNLQGNRADPKARRRKARVCLEPKSSLERTSVQQHWSLYCTALWSSPKSVSLPQAKSSQPNASRHPATTVPALDCRKSCNVGELQL